MNRFVLCLAVAVIIAGAVMVTAGVLLIKLLEWLLRLLVTRVRERREKQNVPVNVLSYHGEVIEEIYDEENDTSADDCQKDEGSGEDDG